MINKDKFPENWEIKKMNEICSYIQRGKQPKYDDENGQVRIINQRCVYWDKFDMSSIRYLDRDDEDSWQDYRYLQDGDVLLTSTGDGTLGRANVWDSNNDVDYVVDGHITILRTDSNLLPMYLYYFLRSPYGQDQIFRYERGSTSQTELYKSDVIDINVPVPLLDEQERIVSVVEERLERVEQLEKSVENIGRLSEEYEESIMAYIFSNLDFNDDSSVSDLPEKEDVPDDWDITTLGELAHFQNGNGFSPDQWDDEGKPIIRIQNLTGSGDSYNYYSGDVHDRYAVENGDILFSWSGTIDAFIWSGEDAWLNQHIYRVDVEDAVNEDYMYYLLRRCAKILERKKVGGTLQHIRKGDVTGLEVPLPPEKEQSEIVSKLESTDFNTLNKGVSDVMDLFEEYRSSILSHAFQGEINY